VLFQEQLLLHPPPRRRRGALQRRRRGSYEYLRSALEHLLALPLVKTGKNGLIVHKTFSRSSASCRVSRFCFFFFGCAESA